MTPPTICPADPADALEAARQRSLAKRASRIGASLIVTERSGIVIQRGASSWHCTEAAAAAAILERLEAAR